MSARKRSHLGQMTRLLLLRYIPILNRNAARSGGSRGGRERGGWPESQALGNIKAKREPTRGSDNFLAVCSASILTR